MNTKELNECRAAFESDLAYWNSDPKQTGRGDMFERNGDDYYCQETLWMFAAYQAAWNRALTSQEHDGFTCKEITQRFTDLVEENARLIAVAAAAPAAEPVRSGRFATEYERELHAKVSELEMQLLAARYANKTPLPAPSPAHEGSDLSKRLRDAATGGAKASSNVANSLLLDSANAIDQAQPSDELTVLRRFYHRWDNLNVAIGKDETRDAEDAFEVAISDVRAVMDGRAAQPSVRDAAFTLNGRVIEVGNVDGGSLIGFCIDIGDGKFASITGLTEDQARSIVPSYYKEVSIEIRAIKSNSAGAVKEANNG